MRIPGLEIREPLKNRPLGGMIHGGAVGVLFGLLAMLSDTDGESLFRGYVAGCASGGLIIGSALPLFRSRFLSGLVVAVAWSVGYWIAIRFWGQEMENAIVAFIGIAAGFAYAVLLWDYSSVRQEPTQ